MSKNICRTLSASMVLLTILPPVKAQLSQGEGIIVIAEYQTRSLDPESNFPDSAASRGFTYHIKGVKILRKETRQTTEFSDPNKTTETINGRSITHFATVTTMQPTYIIDLQKKLTYTPYKENKGKGDLCISVDSLKNHFDDFIYKASLHDWNKGSIKTFGKKKSRVIAGKKCYAAQAIIDGRVIHFLYTKKHLPVISPLNNFIPHFKNNILSISLEITDKGTIVGYMTYEVKEIKGARLDDTLFELPKDVIIKYKVPLEEMVYGLDLKL